MRSGLVVAVALVLVPAWAEATKNFPNVIEEVVGTAGPPPCSLCHAGGFTGLYTVKTPFGRAMLARGVVRRNSDSLRRALAEMKREGVDSDGDGVADIDELEAGTDPNVPDSEDAPPAVAYGCSGAGPRSRAGGVAAIALVLALLAMRRGRSS